MSAVRAALVLTLALLTSSTRAEPIQSISHRDRLYDVTAFGDSLFVVGHPGRLLRSRDGGKTFHDVDGGQGRQALFSIAFNEKGEGAIVGRSGMVLVSADKGESWSATTVKFDEERPTLYAVDVLDDGTIVAVGEFGVIARSQDHGKSWTKSSYTVELPKRAESAAPQGEASADACDALGASEAENEGAIEEARLTDLRFIDDTRGFIVGEFGLVLYTEDGGKTYARQRSCTDKLLYGVAVIDAQRALAVGAEGTVIETANGGLDWTAQKTGTEEHLFGVWADARRAIVLGAAGTIVVRSGDGPFKVAPSDVHTWLVSAWLDDKGQGLIVGGRAYLLRTRDGGNTQQRIFGE